MEGNISGHRWSRFIKMVRHDRVREICRVAENSTHTHSPSNPPSLSLCISVSLSLCHSRPIRTELIPAVTSGSFSALLTGDLVCSQTVLHVIDGVGGMMVILSHQFHSWPISPQAG